METVNQIKNAAIRFLSQREHSQKELLRKLQQKGHEHEDCLGVLGELVELGLQSEQRFAEMIVRTRQQKQYGELRIRAELAEHHLSEGIISTALEENPADYFQLCADVLDKKYPDGAAKDFQTKMKQKRYLSTRGFTMEQIAYALGE